MRFVFFVMMGIFFLAQVGSASDLNTELRKKMEVLERELALLKQQTQDASKNAADADKLPPIKSPFAAPEPKEKARALSPQENLTTATALNTPSVKQDPESAKQSTPDFSQANELYARAQIFLNQKRLDKAKIVLQELCEKYPDSPQFMLARYWLGEIGLEARDYTNASIAYGEAYALYKQKLANKEAVSDEVRYRAIESLAKLAHCLKLLKKEQDACVTLKQFEKESSSIPQNVQAFALQVKQQLKCPTKNDL